MRLIDADALMETITSNHYQLRGVMGSIENGMFTVGIQQAVDEQPTIDAVTVVHGRWNFGRTFNHIDFYVCSECGAPTQGKPPFCCNCGARMDAEEAQQ